MRHLLYTILEKRPKSWHARNKRKVKKNKRKVKKNKRKAKMRLLRSAPWWSRIQLTGKKSLARHLQVRQSKMVVALDISARMFMVSWRLALLRTLSKSWAIYREISRFTTYCLVRLGLSKVMPEKSQGTWRVALTPHSWKVPAIVSSKRVSHPLLARSITWLN